MSRELYSALFHGTMILLLLILSCSQSETDRRSSQDSDQARTPAVQVVTIKEVPFEKEEKFESFLYANKDAFIVAKMAGILKEAHVDLGDEVSEGDTLARIEDELLHLEFKLAKNYFDQVKHEFERYQSLYDKQLISESEYEQMKLKCEQADIEQKWALERLTQSRLIAPFSGVIVSNFARTGQAVNVGDSLFHLTERFPVYTRIFLTEEELTRLKTHGSVRVEPKYGAKKSAWGRIIKRSPTVDPATGTVGLIIKVDARYTFLTPGMTVNVFLKPAAPSMRLALSKSAFADSHLLSPRDTASIYVYKNETAIKRVVELREDLDSLWGIGGGLSAGDSVIVFADTELKDGQKVKLGLTTSSEKK